MWKAEAVVLLGDFSTWPGPQRDIIWQRFLGVDTGRVRLVPESAAAASAAQCVGCLRGAQAEPHSGQIRASTKTIEHPELGRLTLDCDALEVPDADQTVVVYSAAPGTPEATTLELLRVTGTQRLTR
ncbi:hypothetical protein [Nocardia sp. CC227C]|uniref:MmyB family transcriptional regulator n=1 Tax=Nocardia sp. CC227C TaxID=3044562 RepID=UPI00278C3EEE|nr:hypothetical protein [Nocardia sp. CC227C]